MTHHLTKHHGLGNDFLVLLGPARALEGIGADHARRWCDRRRGIGADGLLLGCTDADADVEMVLFNADGSRAEMSGNGIRCLAQAAALERGELPFVLTVATDAGPREVEVLAGGDDQTVIASVDMGEVAAGPEADRPIDLRPQGDLGEVEMAAAPQRTRLLDLGNPHVVLLVDDPHRVVIDAAGPAWEAGWSGGINVHAVGPTPGERDALDLVVWERGAGVTEACGTGATAAAVAAHDWGLVGTEVTVHMPGGDVRVEVGSRPVLRGPSVLIGRVELDR